MESSGAEVESEGIIANINLVMSLRSDLNGNVTGAGLQNKFDDVSTYFELPKFKKNNMKSGKEMCMFISLFNNLGNNKEAVACALKAATFEGADVNDADEYNKAKAGFYGQYIQSLDSQIQLFNKLAG
jgi:hypothetical protein